MKQIIIKIVGIMIAVGIIIGIAIINDPYMGIIMKLIFFLYLTLCIVISILCKLVSIKRKTDE